ncbi:MAG: hypothetical protein KKD01_15305 [Proteobacteria bacterium]|nr:hypothetical protein [Pseudomonadota bacterium]MBU1231938.1 hypothetical protein [Pseudomonadota bacterium]MBU1420527.1 hypothetical protein [Pseudomonadota bacterium]MBU1456090.1 hypothetical protein [Pseudomonadota bacterium]
MNKGKTQGTGPLADNLPSVGSYYAMRRYCLDRGVKTFSYDEFEDRLPKPKGKNEPRGAKVIVRKGSALTKSSQALPEEVLSEVEQLEKQLLKLLGSINLAKANTTKSGKSSYQDLLAQLYHKLEELIKIDPAKAKSPLNSELQRAYERLRTLV